MNAERFEITLSQFSNALNRLQEALAEDVKKTPTAQDAAIQRFEFCYELAWKALKGFLRMQDVETSFPKDVLKTAYRYKLINEEETWLRMLGDRNLTVHTYNEDLAREIYERIKLYHYKEMRMLADRLRKAD